MKNIKIIQIIPNFDLGGAERMVEHLLIALSNKGFDVSVVSLFDKHTSITERIEKENIPIHYLKKKKGLDIKLFIKLYKLLKKEKPYVVHTHLYILPYVMPAVILTRIPIRIHTIHSIATKELSKSRRKLQSFFYKYHNVISVSISPQVKISMLNEYPFLKSDIPMIYNGIDLNKSFPKENYDFKNGKIKILYIGRLTKPKNPVCLIESFKLVYNKYPNALLMLIGAGELEEIVKKRVNELDLENNIKFLGLQNNVFPYLNKADIFVLPSLWEGMPIALIEAMATGLPIVATKVGGIPDMIEDGFSGLLVEPNEEQISSALIKLISDICLREKLGKNALQSSKKFSSLHMAEEYAKLYLKDLPYRRKE